MHETIQVTLDAKLIEELKQTTTEQGVSLDSVLENLAHRYIDEVHSEKLQAEANAYERMHAQLQAQYLNRHVAILDHQVVDHDSDVRALIRRVRERYGRRAPIMIAQVRDQPIREYTLRSPRLVRA